MSSILVVIPKAGLDTPSGVYLKSSKLDAYISKGTERGLRFSCVPLPGEAMIGIKTEYLFLKLPKMIQFWLFSGFSLLLRIFGLHVIRSKVLKAKSKSLTKAWARVLNLISAKAVVGIGLPEELIELCSKREIPSIEIQHGLFDRVDLHKYWSTHKPSHILCWDEYSASEAKAVASKAIVVGHPISIERKFFMSSIRQELNDPSRTRTRFCVALSYGDQDGEGPDGNISKSVTLEIDELVSRGFIPVFRIHPVTAQTRRSLRKTSSWINNRWPEAEIHNPREKSLLDSINTSDFLLTKSSSTALEFSILGKPSIVIDSATASRLMLPLQSKAEPNHLIYKSVEQYLEKSIQHHQPLPQEFTGVMELVKLVSNSAEAQAR